MQPSTVLAIHSWTLYAVAISLIFSRIISRRITLGSFKKLQADDWLMVSVLVPITAVIILANQISNGQSTKQRKYRYVLEELQLITIWLVKACLLVLYWRIFPVETNAWKRYILKGVSAFCCISFLVVQISLIASCTPIEAHWDLSSTNTQCTTYHSQTAVTLAFNIPNTIFIMMLPVPFIPTPRRLLLAVLLFLGTLVLVSGIISRASILRMSNPASMPVFLHWANSESTLSIIFANLPFLTSLVVATAPARIKTLSHNLRASSHMALSQWPRSRRGSWSCVDGSRHGSWVMQDEGMPSPRASRLGSTATSINEVQSAVDVEKAPEWSRSSRNGYKEHDSRATLDARHSIVSNVSHASEQSGPPTIPAESPAERISAVPKTRLSGGLAEMGDISMENTEGWPIYWK